MTPTDIAAAGAEALSFHLKKILTSLPKTRPLIVPELGS
jgi:hypothetical protein